MVRVPAEHACVLDEALLLEPLADRLAACRPSLTVNDTGSPGSPAGLIWWMYHQPTSPATRITTVDEREQRVGDPLDRAGLPPQPLDRARPPPRRPTGRCSSRASSSASRESRSSMPRAAARSRSRRARPARAPGPRRSSRRPRGPRASSHACRMTAAATLSTTGGGAGPRTPPSARARLAVTVVNRSSWVSTGTPTTLARAVGLGPGSLARPGPSPPDRLRGIPTTTHSASSSRDELGDALVVVAPRTAALAARSAARRSCPERSLTATPMRFEPRSRPRARTASAAGARGRVGRDAQRLVDAQPGRARRPSPRRPCRRRHRRRPWRRP